MSILGINSGQSLYNSSLTHNFRKAPAFTANVSTERSSTVNFSMEAKELSQKGQVDENDPEVKAMLEKLALPDWFISFFPKENIIQGDLDLSEMKPRPEYSGEKKRAISYTANTSIRYLQEELKKTGVTADERYDMKISQPDEYAEYDENLHQAVKNRLLADVQYMKYSELLGMTI